MPILNGIQVLMRVKEQFAQLETKLSNDRQLLVSNGESKPPKVQVVRPLIAYLSQNDYAHMKMFCQPEERADLFLRKPLQIFELE